MRVAHLVCPAPIGGAETVVRLLATGRAATGLPTEVVALTPEGDRNALVAALRSAGVPVTVRSKVGRRYLKEAHDVAAVLREHAIDLLHTHVYRADFIGYRAARKAGIPVVSTFHGETGGDLRNRFYQWSVKRLFRRFDAVICVSESNRDKLRVSGSDLSNVHVVTNGAAFPNALDRSSARSALGVDGAEPLVGWIGRLSHEKGPDLLLEAVGTIDGLPLHLVFVGDGPMRTDLAARAADLDVRATFSGTVADVSRLLKAFDVVAISSRTEGMPMVMLESMSAEVPVAAFLVGGIPSVLSEETGWPAPAEDIAALGRAIVNAVRMQPEAHRRAVAAEELIRRNYSVARWLESVERVYATAMSQR